jgi:hypothetical protein
MFDIQRGARQFFQPVPNARSIHSRQDALRGFGLRPDAPVVGVMIPALIVPTHCFGPFIFQDNAGHGRSF